jgi:hypothetical protein
VTRRRSVVLAILAFGPLCAVSACLLADPGGDLPRIPPRRPFIVQSRVVPTTSLVLGTFPSKLVVPVELADPQVPLQYSVFFDYNPATGLGLQGPVTTSNFELNNLQSGLRILEIPLTPPPDLDRCHTLEVVVALQLGPAGNAAHTPREPGGDSVSWFYSPTGDLAGCPALDAGPGAAFVPREAGPEGGPE